MKVEGIVVEKIPQFIVTQIKKNLIEGTLKPGQCLPSELKMAEMFGVSRSSIRDALQTLEVMGVVSRKKRGGTIIRHVTVEDLAGIYSPKPEQETLFDLIETREALEIAVVKLVAQRAESSDIAELEQLIKWMEEKPEQAASADIAFHLALARISKNQVMITIIKSLKETMQKLQDKTIYYPGRLEDILSEHKQILEAIKQRDEERAQEKMAVHLAHVHKLLESINE